MQICEFQVGKKGPRGIARGDGLHLDKELSFLLLGSKPVPGLSGHLEPCPWGRGPQRNCTHRKVAGQKLPVLLSELPHQGPQLLILTMPERQRAQAHMMQKAAV